MDPPGKLKPMLPSSTIHNSDVRKPFSMAIHIAFCERYGFLTIFQECNINLIRLFKNLYISQSWRFYFNSQTTTLLCGHDCVSHEQVISSSTSSISIDNSVCQFINNNKRESSQAEIEAKRNGKRLHMI